MSAKISLFLNGKVINTVYYHKTFNNLYETMKRFNKCSSCIKTSVSGFQLTIVSYRRTIMANIFVRNFHSYTSKRYIYHNLLKETCEIVTILMLQRTLSMPYFWNKTIYTLILEKGFHQLSVSYIWVKLYFALAVK